MAYNTVKIKNYSNVFEEYEANAAISPGMLVELMSTGKIRAHSAAGGDALIMVALEDNLQGKDINDAYAAADRVQCWIPTRGDIGYMRVADEQSITIADFLVSNGNGELKKYVPEEASEGSAAAEVSVNPLQVIGQALETLDLSGLSAAGSSDSPNRQFILVRFV